MNSERWVNASWTLGIIIKKRTNNMKHIFFCLILFAAHLSCQAQSYPKVSEIFKYFKEKGLLKAYTITNINGYHEHFDIYFDISQKEKDFYSLYYNMDKKELPQGEQAFTTFDYVKKMFFDLNKKGIESYDYNHHRAKKDSVIQSIIFKVDHGDDKGVNPISSSNGFMHFKYETYSDSTHIYGSGEFLIRGYTDYTREATKTLDADALCRKLEPILKDKSIKKLTIIKRQEGGFYVYNDKAARKAGFDFFSLLSKKIDDGDQNTLVCKFTDEEKAMEVLHKVMNCVRSYVAEHPDEAYTIRSEDYYDTAPNDAYISYESTLFDTQWDGHDRIKTEKKIWINTRMDMSGFYLVINYGTQGWWQGLYWKTIKENFPGHRVSYEEEF